MDISAKHNADRMAYLNEDLYRQTLWHHVPLTDFWMLGNGTERRLHKLGIYDMYDLCQFPIEILYKEFGVNAEYIIDHAWGKEPTTIQDIINRNNILYPIPKFFLRIIPTKMPLWL